MGPKILGGQKDYYGIFSSGKYRVLKCDDMP